MAYAYKRTITCGNATGSTQTDFPLLIKFDSSNVGTTFKTAGNGGHIQNTVTQSGGNAVTMPADLIFTSDSGGTTKIPWEVESYDGTNGVLWAWVKISSLTTSGATIYVFYDDATVSTQQNTSSYSPSNVWDSNYSLVSHLPDGSTLFANDSTSNGLDGTKTNSPTATTGQIDGAGNFVSSSNQYIERGSGFPTTKTDFTLSAWCRMSSKPSLSTLFQSSQGFGGVAFYVNNFNAVSALYPLVVDNRFTDFNLSASKTYYLVFTRNGTTLKVYVYNYTDSTSGTQSITEGGTEPARDGKYYIGNSVNGGPFDGWIDEVRWSQIDRGADWVATEYNNQSSPLTFNTIGAETSTGGTTTRYDLLLINVGT